jgi:hypothetical protein
MKIPTHLIAFAGVASLLASSITQASYYEYDLAVPDGKGNDGAGQITNLYTSYDPHTSEFSFNVDIKENSRGVLANGYWAVINNGPLPKWHDNEYSIFYADTVNNRLTSYVYNGDALSESFSGNSWINGELIQSYSGALTTVTTGNAVSIDFSIDASAINNYVPPAATHVEHSWTGVQFAETVGMWFHPIFFDNIAYDENGALSALDFGVYADESPKHGWRDVKNRSSNYVTSEHTVVPVPAAAWLFGSGLIGIFAASLRKGSNASISIS